MIDRQRARGNLIQGNGHVFLQVFEVRNEQLEFRDKGPVPLRLSLTSLQCSNLQLRSLQLWAA